jgi:hypothetical protein
MHDLQLYENLIARIYPQAIFNNGFIKIHLSNSSNAVNENIPHIESAFTSKVLILLRAQ